MADRIEHLAMPIRLEGGHFAAVEQGTVEELQTTVSVICHTPVGFREDAPEFGIPDPELRQAPVDVLAIERAVETYEPRADVEVRATTTAAGDAHVVVDVALADSTDETEA